MTVGGTGSSLVLTATQPIEAPGTRGPVTASKSVVTQQNATQLVEAAGAGTATQPVEAPGAGPEALLTGTSNAALHAEITGSDSEEEPGSPVDGNFWVGPQTSTEENQLVSNFLKSLVTGRLSEV